MTSAEKHEGFVVNSGAASLLEAFGLTKSFGPTEVLSDVSLTLRPGEVGTVTLSLRATELRFLGLDLEPVFEPGEVEILVGPSADRSRLLVATINLSWSRPC